MAAPTGRFRRADRILRSREFQHVARHGVRAASGAFVVLAARGGSEGRRPRLGVTVSRRVGKAVVRSRVKRRIREWFRHERGEMPRELDWVVIARPAAAQLAPGETRRQLSELAHAVAERIQ